MNPWLLTAESFLAVWIVLGVLNIVFHCIEYWQAARRREDPFPDGERGY